MIEKTEESENNNRSQSLRLFLCDNKGHMIFQPSLQLAGQRFLLAPKHPLALFCSQSYKDSLPRYRDFTFFFYKAVTLNTAI